MNLNTSKSLGVLQLVSLPLAIVLTFSIATARDRLRQDAVVQQIIDAENLRRPEDPVFDSAGHGSDAELRALVARALGHIGHESRRPLLLELATDSDVTVRKEAAWALGFVFNEDVRAALGDRLAHESSPLVRATLMLALARNGTAADQTSLLTAHERIVAENAELAVLAKSFESLSILASRAKPDWATERRLLETLVNGALTFGAATAGPEADVAIAAAYGVGRYKGDLTLIPAELVPAFAGVANQVARGFLASAVVRGGSDAGKVAVASVFDEPGIQWTLLVDAARALSIATCDAAVVEALAKGWSYPSSVNHHKMQVIETAVACGETAGDLSSFLTEEYGGTPSNWLKGGILHGLAAIDLAAGLPLARQAVADDALELLPSAVEVLVQSTTPEDRALLWPLVSHRSALTVAAVLDQTQSWEDAVFPADFKDSLRRALGRSDLAITVSVAAFLKEKKWPDFNGDLGAAYRAAHADDVEVKVALLETLGVVGDQSVLEVIRLGLADPDRSVVTAAAGAWLALTGEDVSNQIPPISRVVAVTPPMSELNEATAARVQLTTNKGVITVAMSSEAPLAAWNFVSLVKRGFYDGLLFHRVVPHFVAQGGDPRGDGYGGPGYLIRDEFNPDWHGRGTIGMASAGKDTAGSQYFFNLRPNMHLNGNYTVFGAIVDGLQVADSLEQGDVVQRAELIP